MRSRLIALGAGMVLALTGCSADRAGDAGRAPVQAAVLQAAEAPAASAGGACILWDYAFLEDQLGVLFNVAAADEAAETSTCVVQTAGAPRPDLSLSVVEHTDASAKLFLSELAPKGSVQVKQLGIAAYRLVTPAAGAHGPVIEVGWLSADRQVMTLRFTFAVGASVADGVAMSTRMISLAHNLNGDQTG